MTKQSKSVFAYIGFNKRAGRKITCHYNDREVIFAQGDPSDAMFCIRQGHVKITMTTRGERKAAIAILSSGDCFGEGCLVLNSTRMSTATSIHNCIVDRVSRGSLVRRLRAEPVFASLFISHLLTRIGRVEDDLADKLLNSSERRLARLLLQLSASVKLNGRPSVKIKVDQGSLAQVVGTTRERVSFFMNQFRKKGFIDYNGSLQVHKALFTFLLNERSL